MIAEQMSGLFSKLFQRKANVIPAEKRPVLIAQPQGSVPDYQPDFVDICFCGSGKFFKDCCGSRESKREVPYGVVQVANFIDKTTLAELRRFADGQPGQRLMVIDSEASTPGNIVKKVDQRRVSEYVELRQYYETVNQLVKKAFTELPPQHFICEIEWYERPHLMRYYSGGYYKGHADSENMEPETRCWHKVIDRDLSLLLYLNDDFEGGELFFNKFNYRFKPKAGMAVMFPSDNRYMHTAETVEEGVRYAVVSWASAKGIRKVAANPPENIIWL